jgi:hypothetical protein
VVELHSYMHDNKKLQTQPIYARVSRNRYHSISLIPFPVATQTNSEVAGPCGSNASLASFGRRLPNRQSTRVLLSIHTSRSPTDGLEDLISFLKNQCMLPLYVVGMRIEEVVRIEGIYESNSTLTLVSVPLPIWQLLPDHAACHYVGLIRSKNLCQDDLVQRAFSQVEPHTTTATSLRTGLRLQPGLSHCCSVSESDSSSPLGGTWPDDLVLTPQDSSRGSASEEMLRDNAAQSVVNRELSFVQPNETTSLPKTTLMDLSEDRSTTSLKQDATPHPYETQSNPLRSFENFMGVRGKPTIRVLCSRQT